MELPVVSIEGKKTNKKVNLSDDIFGVELKLTCIGFQLSQDQCKKRTLATAIDTDNTHTLAGVGLQSGVLKKQLAAPAQFNLFEL